MSRRKLAQAAGVSVRTAQRAITEFKNAGEIGVARSKKGEVPPGSKTGEPLWCGFSHKWVIGRGMAGRELHQEIARRRLLMQQRTALGPTRAAVVTLNVRRQRGAESESLKPRKRWTAEEIDAEIAQRPRGDVRPREGPD